MIGLVRTSGAGRFPGSDLAESTSRGANTEIWLRYDLRTPPFGPATAELYAAALEQVAWADGRGFTTAYLGEHHGTQDGYLPSPLALAGAIASRTSVMRVNCLALVPMLDPLRLAEDIAVVDLISGGRTEITIGLGYVPSELAMFGVDPASRAVLAEQKLPALRAALTGEPFEFRGRRCLLSPTPVQAGGVPLYVGGAVPAAARRAARFGDGFFPTVADPQLIGSYRQACTELGHAPGQVLDSTGPLAVHVSEDPERAWRQIGPHFLYEMNCYGRWAAEAAAATGMRSPFVEVHDVEELARTGVYAVVTPEQCLELARRQRDAGRIMMLSPLAGGVPPDLAWESLELFAARVLPELQQPAITG